MPIRCTNCDADLKLDFGGRCPYCGHLLTNGGNRKSIRYILMGLLCLIVSGAAAYWLLDGGSVRTPWSLLHPAKVFEVGVQPPSFKVEGIRGPVLSVQELRDLRDLFEKRRFDILTETASDIQVSFERDPSFEYRIYDFFRLFDTLLPGYEELLDAWVRYAPSHFAPHLARAQYYYARAWASRGSEFAAETSAEQFHGMHYYFGKTTLELDKAVALNHRLLPAHVLRIGIHNAEGNEAQEDAAFDEARALFPSSFLIYHTMLWAKLPRWGGGYAEMERIAMQAFKHVEANPQLYILFGEIYADQARSSRKAKHHDMALALYSKAVSYGAHFSFFEERGRTYYFMSKHAEALKDLSEAITLRPGVASPYTLRAYVYSSMGDMSNAKRDIDFADGQFPGDPAIQESKEKIAHQLLRQGHAAFKTDLARAIALYDMTMDLSPKCAEALYWRAVANGRLKKNALAIVDLERAVSIDPHYFECYRMLDHVLASEAKWDEIIDKWSQFLALESDNAGAYFERAGAHKHKGDMKSALADLNRACELGKEEACKIGKAYR